jgi:hypothetical protein
MNSPLQLTADKTTWYAIESVLKFALQQSAMLGDDVMFVHKLQEAVSRAISNAEADDGCAQIR